MVTEKVRPSQSTSQTESLGDHSQHLSKNKNPFLKPEIVLHAIDRGLQDNNEAQFSILQTITNLGIGSPRTGYDPKTPIDSNFSKSKVIKDSPDFP
jgi:hypothetical protein